MTTKAKVNGLGLLTVFFWAAAFPLSKIALEHFSSNSMAVLRCCVASLFLCLFGLVQRIRLPQKKDIPKFFLSGFLGFFCYLLFFNTGVQTLTSATSSIIVATTPIMTAIGAAVLYHEKIKKIGWIAIVFEFLGIVVLSLGGGSFSLNTGILWTLLAAAVFCGYNLYQRKLSGLGYSTYEIVTYSMVGGTVALLFFLPQGSVELQTAGIVEIGIVILLGVFSSGIAYALWGKALSIAEKTSDVTNFMFVTPLLSALLGFLFLSEIPSLVTVLGGGMILAGLLLFQWGNR